MSEFEKVVETMARASNTSYERMANGVEALRAAGWAVVPRKETEEMRRAYHDEYTKTPQTDWQSLSSKVWSAMLAAGEVRE